MKRSTRLHFLAVNFLVFAVTSVGAAAPYAHPGYLTTMPESKKVYVTGSVLKPGYYSLDKTDTVSAAIDKAGGLAAGADARRVEVCRRAKGAYPGKSLWVDLESVRRREGKEVKLKPGDVVYVLSTKYSNGTCQNTLLGLPPTGTSY